MIECRQMVHRPRCTKLKAVLRRKQCLWFYFVIAFAACVVTYTAVDNWHGSAVTIYVHCDNADDAFLTIVSEDVIKIERTSFSGVWSRTDKFRFSAFEDQSEITARVLPFTEGNVRSDEQTISVANGNSYEIHLYI